MARFFDGHYLHERPPPGKRQFNCVKRRLERDLMDTVPHVHGAIICGSVVMGGASPTSDFDLFLMFDRFDADTIGEQMEGLLRLTEYAWRLRVPLKISFTRREAAERGQHTVKHGFYDHIVWAAARGFIGGYPLPHIKFEEDRNPRHAEAVGYTEHAISGLIKKFLEFGLTYDEAGRNLVKAIDMPFHATRRLLESHGKMNCASMSRKGLVAHSRDALGDEAANRLQYLLEVLNEYHMILKEVRARRLSVATHNRFYNEEESQIYHQAILYLLAVARAL